MKLQALLSKAHDRLINERQYGLNLAFLYQSQIDQDPKSIIHLKNFDERGTSLKLQPKGKHVQLLLSLNEAINAHGAIELNMDAGGGIRLDSKGLILTIDWRRRSSEEKIADAAAKHISTPTGRLVWPSAFVLDEKKARHGNNFKAGAPVVATISFKEVEDRIVGHLAEMYALEPVNCRCTLKPAERWADTKPKPSLEVLPTSLKNPRRENTLPRDMSSGGGLVLKIVGSSYRTQKQQEVLRSKNRGNMVLIAHEPDNSHSKHALAVFVWNNGGESYWHHVGYVQDVLAKGLVDRMTQFGGGSTDKIALKGSFVDDPGLGGNPNIVLQEVWSFADSLRA